MSWVSRRNLTARFEVPGLLEDKLSKLKSDNWNTISNRGHVNRNLLTDDDLEIKPSMPGSTCC